MFVFIYYVRIAPESFHASEVVVIPILILVFGLAKPINSNSKVFAMTSGKLIISDGDLVNGGCVCLCMGVYYTLEHFCTNSALNHATIVNRLNQSSNSWRYNWDFIKSRLEIQCEIFQCE